MERPWLARETPSPLLARPPLRSHADCLLPFNRFPICRYRTFPPWHWGTASSFLERRAAVERFYCLEHSVFMAPPGESQRSVPSSVTCPEKVWSGAGTAQPCTAQLSEPRLEGGHIHAGPGDSPGQCQLPHSVWKSLGGVPGLGPRPYQTPVRRCGNTDEHVPEFRNVL